MIYVVVVYLVKWQTPPDYPNAVLFFFLVRYKTRFEEESLGTVRLKMRNIWPRLDRSRIR